MNRRRRPPQHRSLKLLVEALEDRRMFSIGGMKLSAAMPGINKLAWYLDLHWGQSGATNVNALKTLMAVPRSTATPSKSPTVPPTPVAKKTTTTPTPSKTPTAKTPSKPITPATPIVSKPQPSTPTTTVQSSALSVAVGGVLDTTVSSGGLTGSNLSYIITPQPLPSNMTFNLGTGELIFTPAPGQQGKYAYSVAVSNGSKTIRESVSLTVTAPKLTSTEVSGQVVDEAGKPLANLPVTIGGATATTNAQGEFTLTGIPAIPGPLAAGGAIATAQGRLALTSPVVQLLGHALYAKANNIIATPLILPKINWSTPAVFSRASQSTPLDVTNPAMPGFDIRVSAQSAAAVSTGTLSLAQLPASVSAQHFSSGVDGGLLLYSAVGMNLAQPVQLTLPNTQGLKPGAVVNLLTVNLVTGGHDVAGQMVVSADGRTMTSVGLVTLAAASTAAQAALPAGFLKPAVSTPVTNGCLEVQNQPSNPTPDSPCDCGGPTADDVGDFNPPNNGGLGSDPMMLSSDASMVSGAYLQDHQAVTYQSQGQNLGIDLQYSSLQANPDPVVQYQFTTPTGGDSSSITSITAQVSLAGVIQGAATTYNTPGGLSDGATYNIPLQVNASALTSGVYPYSMTVTENFGTGSGSGSGSGFSYGPSSITSVLTGYVNVVNNASDAMGSGWSVGGLEQVSQATSGGPVLVTAGSQATEQFDPVYNSGQTYLQDLSVAASTTSAQVMANDGAGDFSATSATSSSTVMGTVAGDFNGDGKPDQAVVSSSTLAILLNNGSGGFTSGSTYTLPAGETAKALGVGNFTGHTNGVLDLAVLMASTSTGAYSVAVYTGTGSGTFSGPTVSSAGGGTSSGSSPNSMTVGDFNGDGKSDLAFTTDDGLVEVMLASSGGSMTPATSPSLPSGHLAIGVTSFDYNGDGNPDLVVEAKNTNLEESGAPFMSLDLLTGNGTGAFSNTSTYQTVGQQDFSTIGLVTGDFNGSATGLEVAVPISDGGGGSSFIDIVPIATAGTWGNGVLHNLNTYTNSITQPGNIVTADLNGTGKPSIAVATGDTAEVVVLLADPASNQLLPAEVITGPSGGTLYGMLAVAPFAGHAAVPGFRGPTSEPSTLVQNTGGSWTQTFPDGTVLQFNSAGQETSQTDRNGNATTYAYVASGQPGAGSLKTITDPVSRVTTLAYNTSGDLSTITDPAGRVTTITVDTNDNLTKIVDPDGAISQYGYSTPSNHLLTTEVNPNGNTATAHYNSFGILTSETLFDGTSSSAVSAAQGQGLLAPGASGSLPATHAATVTDPDGRTTTLSFNFMDHPTSSSDATGATTSTSYSRFGFPTTVTDALGRKTTYTYNSSGDVTSITVPYVAIPTSGSGSGSGSGFTETITYNDPYGVPTSITDFNGNTTTFTLDSHGNVLQETFPNGTHENWTYNSAGQMLTDTSPNGNTTTFAYDSYGRLTTISYPGTGSPNVHYGYDAAGDLTSITDQMGRTTTYTYDQAGRVLTSQNPVQAAAGKDVAYTYDADGNELTMTDALGHVTSYAYNARNELVSMTDPVNQGTTHHTTYAYDASGNLTSVTDPNGNTTTYAYNQDNQVVGMTDPAGDRTTYVYDLDNELTEVLDPRGWETEAYSYDADGRVQTMTLPATLATGSGYASGSGSGGGGFSYLANGVYTYGYDADGDLLTVTDPLSHVTTSTYNNMNELTSVTDALGHTTSYGYDADRNQTTVTDPLGHTTTYAYDVRDRLVSETDPTGGGTTTYTYDLDGELTSLTDPDGNVTSYTYTSAGKEATETSPTGGVTTYTYDVVGNLTQSVDPDGHTIQYGYDADNRETSEKWISSGSTIYTMTITYDAAGRETSIADNNSAYAYGYNSANELTSVSDAGTTGLPSVTLTYAYDGAGNETSMDDSLGGLTSYTYNGRDQLLSIALAGTGVSQELVTYGYDNAGNMLSLSRYSDLGATSGVVSSTYTYDAANRLTAISDTTPGSTVVASYSYTLDAANRLTQETQTWNSVSSTDTTNYTYTNNNQLTGVTHTNGSFSSETFSYDSNGNRNSTGYTTGTNNEVTTDGTYNYTYDADGNMVTRTSIASGIENIYTYDFRNRLTEVQQVVSGVTTTLAQYTYDALNRRISVVEGGTTTWTLYDGTSTDPLLDFNGSGTQIARYLDGPTPAGVDAVLARQTSAGVAWYLADRLGSVGDIVNNSGTVIDHIVYSAYGTVLSESSPSNGDRFKYAGMQDDAVTGLYYDNARWYDPKQGRFISQDPLGFKGDDDNLYRYVSNTPANAIDPSGLLSPGLWPPPDPPNPPAGPRPRPNPPAAPTIYDPIGYFDINFVGPYLTGWGFQCGRSSPTSWWYPHPYVGIQVPSVGISWAPVQYVSPGWNAGVSLSPIGEGPGVQIGKASGGWFCEVGASISIVPFIGGGVWYVLF